jgi:hypothetical protein
MKTVGKFGILFVLVYFLGHYLMHLDESWYSKLKDLLVLICFSKIVKKFSCTKLFYTIMLGIFIMHLLYRIYWTPDSSPLTSEKHSPCFWETTNPIQFIAFLIAPSFHWILNYKMTFSFCEICFLAAFPYWTTLFIMIRSGYHHTNPFLIVFLTCIAAWRVFSYFKLFQVLVISQGDLVRIQEMISRYHNQRVHPISSLMNLLQDPSKINQLNSSQLKSFHDILHSGLNLIQTTLGVKGCQKHCSMECVSERCCLCLENEPNVITRPCLHQCICSNCIEGALENGLVHCYICKTAIMEWEVITKGYLNRMDLDSYRIETEETTRKEIVQLYRSNPNLFGDKKVEE